MRILIGLGLIAVLFVPSTGWCKIGGGDVKYRQAGADPVVYSHDDHVGKAALKCSECHYKLYTIEGHKSKVTMEEMRQGRSCGSCHNGKRAFDVKGTCTKCHKK